MNRIKSGSLNILRGEFPELLKLPSLWTHSYHVSTIGTVSKETIEKYIKAQKGFEVKRANTFIVEDCPALWKIADNCARHEVKFERRQTYIRYKHFKWYPNFYEKYAPLIGSANHK
jgi:hypothetical protein